MTDIALSGRVNILVAVADSWARHHGYDPIAQAQVLAAYWAAASMEERVELAVVHAAMRPDETVLRQFVEALEGRADRVAAEGT